jgi:hypothetical protein
MTPGATAPRPRSGRELSDAATGTFLGHAEDLAVAGAPLSQPVIFRIGQSIGRVPDEATAFSHRDAKYQRLVAVKNRYDPANLFRLNQNIAPSPQAAGPVSV